MERITGKEEEIMEFFWKEGPLFVKQIWEYYDEPRPHINTLSTIVRNLESYALQWVAAEQLHYFIGFELLGYNALFTIFGLILISQNKNDKAS